MPVKFQFLLLLALMGPMFLHAQSLDQELDSLSGPPPAYTIATFKGTRLINFHTVETLTKGTLEVRIAHRFGSLSSGANNLWGLDGPATLNLHFDYAPTDRLMVGIGRSSDQKVVDGFLKYRLLRQRNDDQVPVSVTGLFTANVSTITNTAAEGRYQYFNSRMFYLTSLLIARKFGSRFSVQVSPIYTHFNIVDNLADKNDLLSIGGGIRYKISTHSAITAEYLKRLTNYSANSSQYYDVLGVGVDIETGGHVFQLFVTNGYAINEPRTIAYTNTDIGKGLVIGFNLSRVFSLSSRK